MHSQEGKGYLLQPGLLGDFISVVRWDTFTCTAWSGPGAAANRKWYPFHVECDTGVDVRYREIMCEGAECVNGTDRSTCEKFDVAESAGC